VRQVNWFGCGELVLTFHVLYVGSHFVVTMWHDPS